MIKIPPQGKHIQDNVSENTGTIYASRNINLDQQGYIRLSERTYTSWTTDNDATFDTADAMLASRNEIYINSDEMFAGKMDMQSITNLSADTNVPTPGVEDDLTYFNETEVVSDGATIKYQSATGVWTTITGTSLPASGPTVMGVFLATNHLAVGRNNEVKFITTSWTVNATSLVLPKEYQVSTITSSGGNLFIGTRSKFGGEAKMFILSGSIKSTADYAYGIGTFEIPSMRPFKSSVVGIDSLGRLMRFNGGGFEMLAQLPVYSSGDEWCDALNDYSTVSVRSLDVDGDLVYINLVGNTENDKQLVNQMSGIWCYDDTNKSFYHRWSPTYSRTLSILGSNVSSISSNTFNLSSGLIATAVTGNPVILIQDSVTQLKNRTTYYLIKTSSSAFKLATTYANAVAGDAITVSGTTDSDDVFYILRENDYGWGWVYKRQSIAVLNNTLFNSENSGRIAMTADLFAKQSTSTSKTVLCGITPFIPNRGYFVTPKINSSNIKDIYNKVNIKFKPLDTEEKIIIKYKTNDRLGLPFSSVNGGLIGTWVGTWVDTNTFTTTVDMSLVIAGDEIEIIGGVGSGHIAHVSSISESSGTYTVNLDEECYFVATNDVCFFNVDNFTKVAVITEGDEYTFQLGEIGKFVQLKVEMRGKDVTIEEININNKTHLPVA